MSSIIANLCNVAKNISVGKPEILLKRRGEKASKPG
jgi:hypothetical protein